MGNVSHKKNVKRMLYILFFVVLLAVLVTGILAIVTGPTSPSTIMSSVVALVGVIAGVIAILPVVVPPTPPTPQPAPQPVFPSPTPSSNNNKSIFHFNMPLQSPADFYGRLAVRTTLINRIKNGGSCSIVGERRVGKTWLLTYLQLIAADTTQLGPSYRVGSLSAASVQCQTLAGFVAHALHVLKIQALVHTVTQPPLAQFNEALQSLKEQGIQAVLCIDEFEGFKDRQEFPTKFFEGIRAFTEERSIVLITASKRPLKEVIDGLTGETSPPFNNVQQFLLRPFAEQEAQEFVQQKSSRAGFIESEQKFFLEHSGYYDNKTGQRYYPPLRLQLVGQMLLAERDTTQRKPLNFQDFSHQQNLLQRIDETYDAVTKKEK